MQLYCNAMSSIVNGRRATRVTETETRLVSAAHDLFVERGYAGTTLIDVADAAHVAPRTVYVRFGTKAALLKRVVDVAIVGDELPIAVADREWTRRSLTAATLDERIAALADGSTDLVVRAGPVIAVAVQAAASEPELASAAQSGREATRVAVEKFWRAASDDGLLPHECDLDWLITTSSLLAHAETFVLASRTETWTADRRRAWMVTTWHRLIAGSLLVSGSR
jgi:AcrR family transcriptional regulator